LNIAELNCNVNFGREIGIVSGFVVFMLRVLYVFDSELHFETKTKRITFFSSKLINLGSVKFESIL